MRCLRFLLVATVTAAAITATSAATGSFAADLVRAEASSAVPEAAPQLRRLPPEVSAVFVDYAGDKELVLNARLALIRYPDMTADVLPIYGSADAFKAILTDFGPAVVPPIHYFLDNRISSLEIRRATGEATRRAKALIDRWWYDEADTTLDGADGEALSPVERGWYAVQFIRDSGHGFLGQFTVAGDNEVHWIQTERVVEGVSSFFTSGVRSLEASLRRSGSADSSDYLWAGIDLAAVIGVTKLLRAGRTLARAGRGAATTSRASRAAITAHTLARGTRSALRIGKWGVPIAIGYAIVRHPTLISSLAARTADWLGTPRWVMQLMVWTLILWPLAWFVAILWRRVARPVAVILIGTGRLVRRYGRPRRPARADLASRAPEA